MAIFKIDLETGKTVKLDYACGAFSEAPTVRPWDELRLYLLSFIHPDDRENAARRTEAGSLNSSHDGKRIDFTYRSKIGGEDYRWYESTMRIFEDENGKRSATLFTSDINDDMEERSRLHDAAEHDGLTDLFNRSKLDSMIKSEYRALSSCGILFFDVNGMKKINDTEGHIKGDSVLRIVSDSIRSVTSRRIHAYRYGGDEFIVVVCNGKEAELDVLIKLWCLRLKALSAESNTEISVAVGASWSTGECDIVRLISEADKKMYKNKKNSRPG